ncbi:MAG TPA: DUF1269 domain-containing protein [Actinomycetota bacterium]|nr:DUF1269 domain-containing protein [Actinomycetota bacterium]
MEDLNLVLYVASYDDAGSAKEDFDSLKHLDDTVVVASVVLDRDAEGAVKVQEHGGGQVAAGATLGGVAGLVVGLFAPPLLAATAVGAVAGGVVGKIAKHHQEKGIASSLDEAEWLPANSSAIVAIVDDRYLDKIDSAVEHASKKVNKAIEKDDYDALVKAINEGGEKVVDAVDS